jgi:hypothetical protein
VLALEQVSGKSPYSWTEAHRGPGLGREGGRRLGPTGAAQAVRNVVGHNGHDRGQVDHLAHVRADNLGTGELRSATTAAHRLVLGHDVGSSALQVRPGGTGLLAALALFGPGLGTALCPFLARPYRVRRRRLAGRRGICLQLRF